MGRHRLYRAVDTSMSAVLTRTGLGATYFGDEWRFSFGELIRISDDMPEYLPAAAMTDVE